MLAPRTWTVVASGAQGAAIGRLRTVAGVFALLLLLLAMPGAYAQAMQAVPTPQAVPALKIGLVQTSDRATAQDVEQMPASAFQTVPEGPLQLRGEPGKVFWLRLDTNLLPLASDDARWFLWVNRARVDRLMLHSPVDDETVKRAPLDFFSPGADPADHDGGYAFALPRGATGPATFYLEVAGQGTLSLAPRIKSDGEVAVADRVAIVLFAAVYTGLLLLLVIGGGIYAALRDGLYLRYLSYLGALLVFLLAQNGHLYEIPWLREWGRLGSSGQFALTNLLAAAMVMVARGFAGLPRSASAFDLALSRFPIVPALLILVCAFSRPELAGALQIATTMVALAAMVLAAVATAMAWRFGRRLAPPMLLLWLLVLATGSMNATAALGWSASGDLTQYAYQVTASLNGLLMSFVLSDRIIEFRVQRDRARLAKEQVDASLKVERERLKFIEMLHSGLRDAPSGDQEWLAFRRLLETVRQLVPQQSSAVALHGFHGHDLLLCEPHAVRNDYQALLATRGGAFKGISRSQLPMQLRIDSMAPADGGQADLTQFAVLPLPLTAPAWGVLLIERRGWQIFEQDELAIAAELAQKATRAVLDAVDDRALRINAEFDSLTGALNRRSIENRMETRFKLAVMRRIPMTALFVDVDQLKTINDAHGLATGDRCLRVLADTLAKHCGTDGLFGRYGGGTFLVMLPEFNNEQAQRWAQAFRTEFNGMELEFSFGTLRISVTLGVAHRVPEDADVQDLILRADKALQAARNPGRDPAQRGPGPGVVRGIGKF